MIEKPIRLFDLVEFSGSGNVASVRKIQQQDGQPVATLRYMRDDGELDYYPFEMTVAALNNCCALVDVSRETPAAGRGKRRPAAGGEVRTITFSSCTDLSAAWGKMACA